MITIATHIKSVEDASRSYSQRTTFEQDLARFSKLNNPKCSPMYMDAESKCWIDKDLYAKSSKKIGAVVCYPPRPRNVITTYVNSTWAHNSLKHLDLHCKHWINVTKAVCD